VSPAPELVVPLLFAIVRSADGASEFVSVAELLPAVGSVVPTGAVMVAVLLSDPVADAAIVAVSV
jgi:hypothetical protein